MAAVEFDNVDIVFGDRPQPALPLLDRRRPATRSWPQTGAVLGVAGARSPSSAARSAC